MLELPDVAPADDPASFGAWLDTLGHVFARIDGHDSGCTSYGVRVGDERWFVKVAFGPDVGQLRSAEAVHRRLRHPAVVPLVAAVQVGADGRAVVYPWRNGSILNDPFVGNGGDRHAPGSTLDRFRRLPAPEILRALDTVVDAHVTAAHAGLVAVDFYDGCLLYDFDAGQVHLVDLDLYAPGPYLLERDRQFGSSRFMAPEEWQRGARVDQRSTVFTLGRTARVLLGEEGAWRGGPHLEAVVARATRRDPETRYGSVPAMQSAWTAARHADAPPA